MTANGNTATPTTQVQNRTADVVARGLEAYQHAIVECDQLRRDVDSLRYAAKCDRVEIEALQAQLNALQSNLESVSAERDQAVAERSLYEALFATLRVQIEAFDVGSAPLSDRVHRATGRRKAAKMAVAAAPQE